jgi:hypothetical protein
MGFPRNTPAPANVVDWKAQSQIFEDAAAMVWQIYDLSGNEEEPEKLEGSK